MPKQKMFISIGRFLKAKREGRGLSQGDVAMVLKVNAQFVSNWERGLSGPPLRMLKTLTRLYEISDEEILGVMLSAQEDYLRAELKMGRKRA